MNNRAKRYPDELKFECIDLAEKQGWKHSEIQKKYGLSNGTVKSWIDAKNDGRLKRPNGSNGFSYEPAIELDDVIEDGSSEIMLSLNELEDARATIKRLEFELMTQREFNQHLLEKLWKTQGGK